MYPYIYLLGHDISSYGLLMAMGLLFAGVLSIRRISKLGGHWEDVLIVGACSIGFGLLCGSILYALVTHPFNKIITCIISGDFSVLGGLVFYGSLLGGLAGSLVGIRLAKCNWHTLEHAIVPAIPLGHAFGRIGCIMAGCCHGMPYTGPFALYYPSSLLGLSPDQGYFPVQLLEALLNLILFAWLMWKSKHKKSTPDLLLSYLTAYSLIRLGLEFLRGDPARGHFLFLSVSQWISVFILITCGIWKLHSLICAKARLQ